LHHITRRTTIAAAVGLLMLSSALTGCGGSPPGSAPGPLTVGSTSVSSPRTLAKVLLLDFEQSDATLGSGARIASGLRNGPRGEVAIAGHDATPLRVVSGRDGKGHAVAFPAPCPPAQEKTCPKEIIDVYPDT